VKTLHFILVLFALGSLLTSSGFSDVSAAKNDNNGKALGCENASEKSKGIEKNPNCVPPIVCPPGTHEENGVCVDDPPIVCPPGTHEENGVCVDDPPIVCPPGTHEENGICVDDPPIVCPPGTHEDNGICVDDPPIVCPPGTHEDNGVCVVDHPSTEHFTACDLNGDGAIHISELTTLGYTISPGQIDFIEGEVTPPAEANDLIDTQAELDLFNFFFKDNSCV